MMKYLKHNYKEILKVTLLLSLFGILLYILPIFIESGQYYKGVSNLTSLNIFLISISILVPIYNFSVLKLKGVQTFIIPFRQIKTLNFQFYIKGLIEIILAFIVVYIVGFIAILIKDLVLI